MLLSRQPTSGLLSQYQQTTSQVRLLLFIMHACFLVQGANSCFLSCKHCPAEEHPRPTNHRCPASRLQGLQGQCRPRRDSFLSRQPPRVPLTAAPRRFVTCKLQQTSLGVSVEKPTSRRREQHMADKKRYCLSVTGNQRDQPQSVIVGF